MELSTYRLTHAIPISLWPYMQIGTLITKLQAHRPLVITGKNGKNRYAIVYLLRLSFLWYNLCSH